MTIDGETYELLSYNGPPVTPALTLTTSGITLTASRDVIFGATWYNLFYAPYPVRAVRGLQSDNTFVDNGDSTVTDTSTGLMWQQSTSNKNLFPWTAALSYCEALTLAGYTDWRLPNMKELRTIVDYKRSPAIDTDYFSDAMFHDYWSSTTREVNPRFAWGIDFNYGQKTATTVRRKATMCVLCAM